MIKKQTNKLLNLLIITFTVLVITGCAMPPNLPENPIENPEDLLIANLKIDVKIIQSTNSKAEEELTNPSSGTYQYKRGDNIEINALEFDQYKFLRWEIVNILEHKEIQTKNHTFTIPDDTVATAYFGCANNDACPDTYFCNLETNLCENEKSKTEIKAELKDASYLSIILPPNYTTKQMSFSIKLLSTLKEHKYHNLDDAVKLYDDISLTDATDKVTVLVRDEEKIITTGIQTTNEQKELAEFLERAIKNLGTPEANIKTYSNNNLDISSLFY
ncbi:MAG: hypothetical protein ACLFN8_04125 [Candidatus Woesearchaeota archaeon]